MTTAATAVVHSVMKSARAAFNAAAHVFLPHLEEMKEYLRMQMTIHMDASRELITDFMCGGQGPRLRLARTWIVNRWRNTYAGFSGLKTA